MKYRQCVMLSRNRYEANQTCGQYHLLKKDMKKEYQEGFEQTYIHLMQPANQATANKPTSTTLSTYRRS